MKHKSAFPATWKIEQNREPERTANNKQQTKEKPKFTKTSRTNKTDSERTIQRERLKKGDTGKQQIQREKESYREMERDKGIEVYRERDKREGNK